MKNDIFSAFASLRPKVSYYCEEPYAYEDLILFNTDETKPTKEEIEAKISELDLAEPMRLLREVRDEMLLDTDWTQNDDISSEIKSKWATYRQQLRDLPATADPKLNSNYDLEMSSVTWPTKPS